MISFSLALFNLLPLPVLDGGHIMLACLEMIKTGTTTFNDHYWYMPMAHKAVMEMGLRAVLAYVI